MGKKIIFLATLLLGLPLGWAANYSGTYICENDTVVGTVVLDDSQKSHFMEVEIEHKVDGIINELSGSAIKSHRTQDDLTIFTMGNTRMWFHQDGSIEYNKTIVCYKK